MRWNGLFDDLEAQADALEQAERAAEVETRTRGEVGRLRLVDRLRPAVGTPLRMRLAGGLAVSATLLRVGPDWLLLDETGGSAGLSRFDEPGGSGGREIVVVTAALLGVRGLGRVSAAPGHESVVESRLGLRSALRAIARDRSAVRLHLNAADGGSRGSSEPATVDATIDRVGADFVEVAAHSAGEARRRRDVREVELIPLAALVAVRRSV